jgi:hypothetical protein
LVRERGIPPLGATVHLSPNGKFCWEYESPSDSDEDEALRKFTYIKAVCDGFFRQAGYVLQVPIPEPHVRCLKGSHSRTYRDSILMGIERLEGHYSVVVIIQ